MTNLKRIFVLAAVLFLALGPISGGMASAQTEEIVGIEISHPAKARVRNGLPFTRFALDRVIGSAEGVTVDLTANTVRLEPGKYWFSNIGEIITSRGRGIRGNLPLDVREIPAVSGEDSTGTTVEMMKFYFSASDSILVVVDGEGATEDDVKLETVGRRVDLYCCGGIVTGNLRANIAIRRLDD